MEPVEQAPAECVVNPEIHCIFDQKRTSCSEMIGKAPGLAKTAATPLDHLRAEDDLADLAVLVAPSTHLASLDLGFAFFPHAKAKWVGHSGLAAVRVLLAPPGV